MPHNPATARTRGDEDPRPCPSCARTRQNPGTLTGCQAQGKPQLTREAAVGHQARYDLLSGRSRVRVAVGAHVICSGQAICHQPVHQVHLAPVPLACQKVDQRAVRSSCSGRWTARVLKTYRDTVDLATM
jgi:hypothetical protein